MDSVPKSLNPNKQLREQFVSNLAGASFFKIFVLLAIIPFLFLLQQSINFSRPPDASAMKKTSKKDDDLVIVSKSLTTNVSTISVDFVFIVLPMLLFFTILSEWTFLGFILWLVVVFSIACKRQMLFGYYSYFKEGPHSFRNIISSYRVATMIMTCLCILAVDFEIFPGENAKTETYGTSLVLRGIGQHQVTLYYLHCFAPNKPRTWARWLPWPSIGTTLPIINLLSATVSLVDQQLEDRDAISDELRMHLLQAQQKMKAQVDNRRHDQEFEVGELVFLKLKPHRQRSVAKRRYEKLAARFYGPFKVLQRIGKVAYKLELPTSATIHPFFYVSPLHRVRGSTTSSPILPPINSDFYQVVKLEQLLGVRQKLQGVLGGIEGLIKWKDLSEFEATWEDFSMIQHQFPDFQLED